MRHRDYLGDRVNEPPNSGLRKTASGVPNDTAPLAAAEAEIVRLQRRLARERGSRAAAEEIAEAATKASIQDAVTGLPNRTLLESRLTVELQLAERKNGHVLVLFLNINSFRLVNETHGHDVGNELLVHIASVLERSLRPQDTVGRVGSDEFVLIASGVPPDESEELATRVMHAIANEPLIGDGFVLPVNASVGAACVTGAVSASEAIHQADVAMNSAKSRRLRRFQLYTNQLREQDQRRLSIIRSLPGAIVNREFLVHYQPIVDLNTGITSSLEALVRWHRDDVMIPPGSFVEIAEESGYIADIGLLVIEMVLQDVATWRQAGASDAGWPVPPVAVNVSAKQLLNPGFARSVAVLLKKHALDARALNIELTETALIENDDITNQNLADLQAAGHQLSLDDFGTGYSSLGRLRDISFGTVKVDKSFIDAVVTNYDDQVIVRTVNSMAHTLGATTIAEGVETAAQLEVVRALGCDKVQGFFFAKPQPAHEAQEILKHVFDIPTKNYETHAMD